MAKASRAAPETASEDVRRRMRSGLGPERSRPGYLAEKAPSSIPSAGLYTKAVI